VHVWLRRKSIANRSRNAVKTVQAGDSGHIQPAISTDKYRPSRR
jgi:hypothetical protein